MSVVASVTLFDSNNKKISVDVSRIDINYESNVNHSFGQQPIILAGNRTVRINMETIQKKDNLHDIFNNHKSINVLLKCKFGNITYRDLILFKYSAKIESNGMLIEEVDGMCKDWGDTKGNKPIIHQPFVFR